MVEWSKKIDKIVAILQESNKKAKGGRKTS